MDDFCGSEFWVGVVIFILCGILKNLKIYSEQIGVMGYR